MKRHYLSILALLISSITAFIFAYKFYQSKNENHKLKQIVTRSISVIDRDSKSIHKDLWIILNNENFQKSIPELLRKKYFFDSSIDLANKFDSSQFKNDIITFANKKLYVNDSLYSFASNWCRLAVTYEKYFHFETLKHIPIYKYGDTIIFNSFLASSVGFEENNYEIIDFYPNEFGKKTGNNIDFFLPTRKLTMSPKEAKVIKFDYKLIIKNNYSRTLDTTYNSVSFTIIP